ncbi:MAG: class I SAM-dependent methyltransferase [Gammaproteobacteria bacterium]|nr:class I SAM-dependent methyltransferase [Gammaproteobacteria bacterium]
MQEIFWDRRARKYDDEISHHDSLYQKTLQSTETLLNDQDVLLDLGCASGEISLDLAPLVAQVHGIDTSGRMIELANQKMRARDIRNIDFSRIDAFDRSLETHSFSAITAFNVLHLVENLSGVLDRLYCLLTPGGLLVSQTPCLRERGWIFRILVRLAQKSRLCPPILNIAFDELAPLFIRSGFEILDSELWDESQSIQRVVARRPQDL